MPTELKNGKPEGKKKDRVRKMVVLCAKMIASRRKKGGEKKKGKPKI